MSGSKGPQMNLAGWQSECSPSFPPSDMSMQDVPTGDMADPTPLFRIAREANIASLAKAIEDEVIPLLIEARRAEAENRLLPGRTNWQPNAGEIDHFVRLLLDRDETLAVAHLRALLDTGIRLETLYSTLLTQAARQLGVMWDEDEVNFTSVTTAVWRMQQILHTMSKAFVAVGPAPANPRRVLLVPAVGEQHSFGLSMVSEFFRKAGWEVVCEIPRSNDELADLVRSAWFDVVGISTGIENQLAALTTSIAAIRRVSRNLQLGVMVGGPVFVANPGFVADVGADATAADAAQATVEAERLVTSLAASG